MADKNYNAHRTGKRSFQANLKPEENDLVQTVKALRGVSTDRELLILLATEEKKRLVTSRR